MIVRSLLDGLNLLREKKFLATDIQKLISEVATKNRVLVDPDDPVFAVVTMNRLMLDEAVEGLLTRVGVAITKFEASTRLVEAQSGKSLAEELRSSTSAWKAEIAKDLNIANARCCEMIDKIHRAHSRLAMRRWGAVGVLAGLILFGCGYFARDIYKIDAPVSAARDVKGPAVSKTTLDRRLQNRASGRATHAPEGLLPNEIEQSRSRKNPEINQ